MKNTTTQLKFCCSNFESECDVWSRDNQFPDADKTMRYDPITREYGYYITKRKTFDESSLQLIDYCPFCGAKLPKWLYDEYLEALEKALGKEEYKALFYEDPENGWCLDRSKTPKEFQTDEWWIKRGL